MAESGKSGLRLPKLSGGSFKGRLNLPKDKSGGGNLMGMQATTTSSSSMMSQSSSFTMSSIQTYASRYLDSLRSKSSRNNSSAMMASSSSGVAAASLGAASVLGLATQPAADELASRASNCQVVTFKSPHRFPERNVSSRSSFRWRSPTVNSARIENRWFRTSGKEGLRKTSENLLRLPSKRRQKEEESANIPTRSQSFREPHLRSASPSFPTTTTSSSSSSPSSSPVTRLDLDNKSTLVEADAEQNETNIDALERLRLKDRELEATLKERQAVLDCIKDDSNKKGDDSSKKEKEEESQKDRCDEGSKEGFESNKPDERDENGTRQVLLKAIAEAQKLSKVVHGSTSANAISSGNNLAEDTKQQLVVISANLNSHLNTLLTMLERGDSERQQQQMQLEQARSAQQIVEIEVKNEDENCSEAKKEDENTNESCCL